MPGPVNRRQLVKRKSYTNIRASKLTTIAERLGTARTWIKKLFKKKESEVEDDWEEEEEEEDEDANEARGEGAEHLRQDHHGAQLEQISARGKMEGYFWYRWCHFNNDEQDTWGI